MSKVPLCMELDIEWGEDIISVRWRAKMAHVRQSRPDSGLGFQVKILKMVSMVPYSFASGGPDIIPVQPVSPQCQSERVLY